MVSGSKQIVVALAVVWAVAGSVVDAVAQPLVAGRPLLAAGGEARAVVLGMVRTGARVDKTAYMAVLSVDSVLAGRAGENDQPIAWEELARDRPPRLSPGDRVLVALAELPADSLWQKRFPGDTKPLVIAARGEAYLVNPDEASVAGVAAYLAIPAPQRTQRPGIIALTRLVADADPVLAEAALELLRSVPSFPADQTITVTLMTAAASSDRPFGLRSAIVALAGERKLARARPWLMRFAVPGSDLEAAAYTALGEWDGELPQATVQELLDRDDPAVRAVGARFARGDLAERRLPGLVRGDPAAQVRAAAVLGLVATRTSWGLEDAIAALADRDPAVRGAAAQAISRLGTAAIPALEREVDRQSDAAAGAIAALSMMGQVGRAPLLRIVRSNPNPQLRELALLGLGQVRGEHD
jgi:hypothetical protein